MSSLSPLASSKASRVSYSTVFSRSKGWAHRSHTRDSSPLSSALRVRAPAMLRTFPVTWTPWVKGRPPFHSSWDRSSTQSKGRTAPGSRAKRSKFSFMIHLA